jgi:PAS domain S-box-containing protein
LAFVRRKPHAWAIIGGYALVTGLLMGAAFARVFPTCYVEGVGLTPFKKFSEYLISALLLVALLLLLRRRAAFAPTVFRWLAGSIVVTIGAELAFTAYVSVYGPANAVGHLLKLVSFYWIYKAIIETALTRPYDLLLREVQQRAAALQQSEGALRAIIESSPQAVVLLDADGRVVAHNERIHPRAQALLGGRPPQVGVRLADWLPPAQRAELQSYFEQALTGTHGQLEQSWPPRPLPDAAGATAWFDIQYHPVTRNDGAIMGVCMTVEDITQRKLQEAQLHETQRLESIGVLAGGVAHEFNNAFTALLTRAALALRSLTPEHPARRQIEKMITQIERAAELVRQLLAYAGKGQHAPEALDLSQLVRDNVELWQTTGRGRIELRLRLAPDLPKIMADRGQIQQLVTNLIINAVEAIPERGEITLTTSACRRAADAAPDDFAGNAPLGAGAYVCLAVSDSGIGIDPALTPRLFDPFYTTKFAGRGLGLPAALGIARAHGGGIQVRSAPGQGATFTVWLPAAHTDAESKS